MKWNRYSFFLGLMSVVFLVASCDSIKDTLGLHQDIPDSTAVVMAPPIEIPPDDFYLPAPSSGNMRRPHDAHDVQAQALVVRELGGKMPAVKSAALPSMPSVVQESDPQIRQKVMREFKEDAAKEKTLMQQLALTPQTAPAGQVIDPIQEQKRLESARKS